MWYNVYVINPLCIIFISWLLSHVISLYIKVMLLPRRVKIHIISAHVRFTSVAEHCKSDLETIPNPGMQDIWDVKNIQKPSEALWYTNTYMENHHFYWVNQL